MRVFQAEVVDIRDEGMTNGRRRWQLLLTESRFDGLAGVLVAVSPGGTRLEVPVLGFVLDGADVWHVVEKPLAAGTPVTGQVFAAGKRIG